jgi:hypothetical protein
MVVYITYLLIIYIYIFFNSEKRKLEDATPSTLEAQKAPRIE